VSAKYRTLLCFDTPSPPIRRAWSTTETVGRSAGNPPRRRWRATGSGQRAVSRRGALFDRHADPPNPRPHRDRGRLFSTIALRRQAGTVIDVINGAADVDTMLVDRSRTTCRSWQSDWPTRTPATRQRPRDLASIRRRRSRSYAPKNLGALTLRSRDVGAFHVPR